MRSFIKIGVPVAAASLLLAACGGTTTTGSGSGTAGGGTQCDYKVAYFGALTGDAANLGINIKNGVELAVNQYNEKNPNCKVTLQTFDSEGDPAKAPALAQKAVTEKKILGIVGPAFSGESKAANPIFNQAGLNLITASATNPALADNGWKVFHRMLGNDATQGPAAATYMRDVLKAKKVFVIDDSSEYGKGLSDIVRKDLGATVVGNDSVQGGGKQTDFSATVTKASAAAPDAVYFGGYYAEASNIIKQLRTAGWKGNFVVADGVKDDAYIKQAGTASEGTIITCPCLPPEKAPEFAKAFRAAYKSDPATYSAEAFDSANVFLDGIKDGKVTNDDMNAFIKTYDKPGVTKRVKFDERGEPAEVSVWAYKVIGAKITADREIK
ncbi:MAG TPA: branched-chain amino acid ABC transporter substrate-binding protein [Dermatophilaceae bacterium]|nr:branched-chain amino acid ABC transporter substrate-binding protein [Dermatophilaceae bacterium]